MSKIAFIEKDAVKSKTQGIGSDVASSPRYFGLEVLIYKARFQEQI
jgi:hypothetical protein